MSLAVQAPIGARQTAARRGSSTRSDAGARQGSGRVRPDARRPGGVRPPRVSFGEIEARGCRWVPTDVPTPEVAGLHRGRGWRLTTRGVAVVVSATAAMMAIALVGMVLRFLAVTAA